MVTSVGYAYPWDDLDDIDQVGVDAVAVAAAYHSTRAATPRHPSRRMVTAAHAALYLPVRPRRWTGRLVPHEPSWGGSYLDAQARLRAKGIPAYAWTVLTHSTILASANPDLAVRNAFGETYEYALCPSADEVADYCATLVAEIVDIAEPDGLVLEACGPLGVDHGGHHDKLEFAAWTKVQRQFLSLCFCAACARRYTNAGIDPARLADTVRSAARPDSVADALGELAEPVRLVRTGIAAELRTRLVDLAADRPVVLHGNPDPWQTGPFATVADGDLDGIDTVVVNAWGDPAAARRDIEALRGITSARIGAYVRPDTLPDDLDTFTDGLLAAGASELHLYHLGLVPEPALRTLADLVTTAGRRSAPSPHQIGGSR